jgi:hypothetical protein
MLHENATIVQRLWRTIAPLFDRRTTRSGGGRGGGLCLIIPVLGESHKNVQCFFSKKSSFYDFKSQKIFEPVSEEEKTGID